MSGKIGRVASTSNGKLKISGFGNEHENAPIISIAGIKYKPKTNDEGFLLPLEDNFIYLGSISSLDTTLKEGEIKISCGGGYIYLRDNGSVIINGLMITNDGKIIEG